MITASSASRRDIQPTLRRRHHAQSSYVSNDLHRPQLGAPVIEAGGKCARTAAVGLTPGVRTPWTVETSGWTTPYD